MQPSGPVRVLGGQTSLGVSGEQRVPAVPLPVGGSVAAGEEKPCSEALLEHRLGCRRAADGVDEGRADLLVETALEDEVPEAGRQRGEDLGGEVVGEGPIAPQLKRQVGGRWP